MDGSMVMRLMDIESRLPPGFRFHPSDEELVCYYLRAKVSSSRQRASSPIIVSSPPAVTMLVEVDLHVREPWDLPVAAKLGDKQEWYFFSSRDRKYATGSRTNRATPHGYWKATGKDKVIHDDERGNGIMVVGMRKTLVFHFGRAPNGRKSDWVMHEFRLVTSTSTPVATETAPPPPPMEENWVLCRVFHRGKGKDDDDHSDLTDMITSSGRLQSLSLPPQPAENNLDGRQLLPISVSSSSQTISISGVQLVRDYHGGLTMGQDAMPDDDDDPVQPQAAAGDGGFFVEFLEWPDARAQMDIIGYDANCMQDREMEMALLQQGGNNYFPCT